MMPTDHACTCPPAVSALGRPVTRHTSACPDAPRWCVGVGRPPHVVAEVRPRPPDSLPMCPSCDLASQRDQPNRRRLEVR